MSKNKNKEGELEKRNDSKQKENRDFDDIDKKNQITVAGENKISKISNKISKKSKIVFLSIIGVILFLCCLLYTSPSPRDCS